MIKNSIRVLYYALFCFFIMLWSNYLYCSSLEKDETTKECIKKSCDNLTNFNMFNYDQLKSYTSLLKKRSQFKEVAQGLTNKKWEEIKDEIKYFKEVPFNSFLLSKNYDGDESPLIKVGAYRNDADCQSTYAVFYARGTGGYKEKHKRASRWILKAMDNDPSYSLEGSSRVHHILSDLGLLYNLDGVSDRKKIKKAVTKKIKAYRNKEKILR